MKRVSGLTLIGRHSSRPTTWAWSRYEPALFRARCFTVLSLRAWSDLVLHTLVDWTVGLLHCVCCPRHLDFSTDDTLVSRKRYRLRPRSPLSSEPRHSAPGVSILRPLKGFDTNLYENLESSFTQDYPNFEI